MQINTFIKLIFRLFVLYALVSTALFSVSTMISTYSMTQDILLIVFGLAGLVLSVFLFYWLIQKTDSIITLLKLDKGFEGESIPFEKLDGRVLVQTGCILIGGFVFFNGIPDLLIQGYMLFSFKASNSITDSLFGREPAYVVADFIKATIRMAVGYLVFANSSWISTKFSSNAL